MKGRLIFLTILFFFLLANFNLSKAQAVTIPTFPSCTNPQGTLKVQYDQGTHGIPGDLSEHKGSDKVYVLNDSTLFQCFCIESGTEGIQTNWWKASSLSESEINILLSQGWNYIPNGSLWGLDNTPYLTKNESFSCAAVGGEVLGEVAPSEVLGIFAPTGNSPLIYGLTAFGIFSLLLGIWRRKKELA